MRDTWVFFCLTWEMLELFIVRKVEYSEDEIARGMGQGPVICDHVGLFSLRTPTLDPIAPGRWNWKVTSTDLTDRSWHLLFFCQLWGSVIYLLMAQRNISAFVGLQWSGYHGVRTGERVKGGGKELFLPCNIPLLSVILLPSLTCLAESYFLWRE